MRALAPRAEVEQHDQQVRVVDDLIAVHIRIVGTRCAEGEQYLQRMSNYCAGCRYKPDRAVGEDACPFTTLYWDFLMRHEPLFESHPRLGQQVRNLRRLSEADRAAIRAQAAQLRYNTL